MMSWDMNPTAMIAGDDAGSGAGDQRRSCFCCGEVGHFARDCLQRVNRNSPGAVLTCFACGQPGHFARDCPNKFTRNRTRNRPSRPNRTAGITRAGGMSAGRGEGGPNHTAGISRAGGTGAGRGEGGPNHTNRITRAEGGPNRTIRITRVGGTSVGGGEGDPGITQAGYMSASGRDEGGPNRTAGLTRAGGTGASGGEGGPNCTAGITRASCIGGGEGSPNRTAGITRAGGMGVGGGEGGPNHTTRITRVGGTAAGRGLWIRRRELPHTDLLATADQSKDSTSIHDGGIGGASSSNQMSYFPPTLSREYGGSGSSPDEPVSHHYDNVNWKYDTGKFFGSSGVAGCSSSSSSRREYSNLLDISRGDCGEGSSGSSKDSGEGSSASRGPAVIEISSFSCEDAGEGIVRKKTTGFLFPVGKVEEEIKWVVDDDADDDDYDDDDDDCVILEYNPSEPPTADFEQLSLSEHKSSIVHDEDITIISERGQVACRDYPHSRHHCAKFPFSKTTHESCCPQCYCYICEVVAPCEYWDGSCGHCHASDLDSIWGVMKKNKNNPVPHNGGSLVYWLALLRKKIHSNP